jgi:3-dehydroquinate synthase class II
VQSLDEKRNILNVNAVEGGVTEIFPIKRSTHVFAPDGSRLKLGDLAPGTNVLVYFDLRADHRSVTRIDIIPSESKKPAPPS